MAELFYAMALVDVHRGGQARPQRVVGITAGTIAEGLGFWPAVLQDDVDDVGTLRGRRRGLIDTRLRIL